MSLEGLIPQLQARGIQVDGMKHSQQSVSVYKGHNRATNVEIRVLTLTPGMDFTLLRDGNQIQAELSQHPNILRLYDYFWADQGNFHFFVIVTDSCWKDLAQDMKYRADSQWSWGEDELWKLAFQIVSALTYMQEQGYSHRNIKLETIFLTLAKVWTLGEFDYARSIFSDSSLVSVRGTRFYMSPKLRAVYENRERRLVHNSFKSDVYSLGLTLLSLTLLGLPLSLDKANVSSKDLRTVINTVRYSDLFKTMLGRMLSVNEDTRDDFKMLSSWMTNMAFQQGMFQVPIQDSEHPIQKQSTNIQCLQCWNVVDRYAEEAPCEVIQLYCQPTKHMFCSRGCFITYLSQGKYKCSQCNSPIAEDIIAYYQVEQEPREPPGDRRNIPNRAPVLESKASMGTQTDITGDATATTNNKRIDQATDPIANTSCCAGTCSCL